ncbi:30S ribosome-binding factor RbfA [Halalkalibaculum sp. DA3122]|uniref:30S ribosome-binding factor RbfA n=1 Tax=unclassified Halalkalibaculum TaxID=2964617 RepID=UPI003753F445
MSIRTERLGAVIQRDLGNIIQRQYQKPGTFITVTAVRMTEDLMIAKVFISIYAPGRDEDAIYHHLEEHLPAIRKELASKIRHQVRKIPELNFVKDETADYVNKMENLFEKIRREREQRNNDQQE